MAIVGHLLHNNQMQQGQQQLKLRLHWQRDGQLINDLNLARGRFSSVQLASETDPETISHLLGSTNSTGDETTNPATNRDQFSWLSIEQNDRNQNGQPDMHQIGGNGFILFPFIDEQQLERLERAPTHSINQVSIQARHSMTNTLKKLSQEKSPTTIKTIKQDNFLADGQSIQWRKFGSFLRQAGVSTDQQVVPPQDCPVQSDQQAQRLEQLTIIQLEINQLRVQDRGQYQLFVCQQVVFPAGTGAVSTPPVHNAPAQQQTVIMRNLNGQGTVQSDCLHSQLVATIALQVVEDVPRLESWFSPQLLNPGDRFSIKCEATGFTLPQISWFLDGQLLSEHQGGASSAGALNHRSMDGINMNQLESDANNELNLLDHSQQHLFGNSRSVVSSSQSFRIGDYVSQDNHVHSFVNSSSIKLTDGGFYRCQANNGLHVVEHDARIDVRGQANIGRSMGSNASTLAGSARFELQCPFSGHPVGPIEWFFKPTGPRHSGGVLGGLASPGGGGGGGNDQSQQAPDYQDVYSTSQYQLKGRTMRRKRRPIVVAQDSTMLDAHDEDNDDDISQHHLARAKDLNNLGPEEENDDEYTIAGGAGLRLVSAGVGGSSSVAADDQQQPDVPDPDKDEWLAQASSLTEPPTPDEYPEPLPDYPIPVLDESMPGATYRATFDSADSQQAADQAELMDEYSETIQAEMNYRREKPVRNRRATGDQADKWVKLPQSRRHQVHPNGTLAINDIQQDDEGLYKCHVTSQALSQSQQQSAALMLEQQQQQQQQSQLSTWSNELHLAVLVPPVISPFGSSESLREGMRNFLTCSVIEGDSPVRLVWLKDGRPIEEHIARAGPASGQQHSISGGVGQSGFFATENNNNNNNNNNNMTRRIKVETSNEYTSTLYFSHVDFRDNGNYTCVATNKAASVNYTARMVVNVPPKWTKNPKDVESVAGQNIVIDCQAEAHPSPRIWWEIGVATVHNNHHPNGDQQQQQLASKLDEFHPSRLGTGQHQQLPLRQSANLANQQQHQHETGLSGLEQPPNHYRTIISNSRIYILENASLVIRDVGKQDQGYYLCQAANNFGLLSALIKLTVNVGASFANKYQMKYVRLGERVELDCDPNGQAPVTVTWLVRAGQQQSTGTGGLPSIGNQLNQSFASSASSVELARRENLLQFNGQLVAAANNQSSSNYNRPARQHTTIVASEHETDNDHRLAGLETSQANGRRRLYTGTIHTELPAASSSASSSVQSNNQAGQQPAASLSTTNSLSRQASHADVANSATSVQPTNKLIEIDSSMSFEILKSRRQIASSATSNQATQTPSDNQPEQVGGGGGEIVRLHIKQARRVNSGEYICHVANQFGSDEKLIKLLVQEPPDPIREISALQIDSRSISIAWPAPFNGNSPITSYTVEWAPLDDQTMSQSDSDNVQTSSGGDQLATVAVASSQQQNSVGVSSTQPVQRWSQLVVQQPAATIGQLQPMTSYEIRVRAHNQFGHSQPFNGPMPPSAAAAVQAMQPLVVTTSEEAPAAPPGDIKAIALSSSKIQVTWMPPSIGRDGLTSSPAGNGLEVDQSGTTQHRGSKTSARRTKTRRDPSSSIKGYYMGYKVANSNDSFIFKTISVPSQSLASSDERNKMNALALIGYDDQYSSSINGHGIMPANIDSNLNSDIDRAHSPQVDSTARIRVMIGDLKRSTKYSIIVQAYNSAGPGPQSDPVEVRTLQNDPPPAPILRVGLATFSTLELQWSFRQASPSDLSDQDEQISQTMPRSPVDNAKTQAAAIIEGYHLYYRPASNPTDEGAPNHDWQERRLAQETHTIVPSQGQLGDGQPITTIGTPSPDLTIVEQQRSPSSAHISSSWSRFHGSNTSLSQRTFRYLLDQLTCGNFYQIYLVAYNSYGSGLPSQVIRAKTRGSVPIAPRRQQDFIQANSSYVQLNLAAWQDGGCALTNFEIKYKQLHGRTDAINMLNSHMNNAGTSISQEKGQSDNGWLLLSNNISPEQRSIELRDLQPETWYGIWVTTESSAGKTNIYYAFMTLDKFGQLPNEAVEPLPSLTSGNNLPALFRSGSGASSIRSILFGLSNSANPNGLAVPPLVLSACLCLIIFATCALFIIRRYNNLVKDDQSIDLSASQSGQQHTTTATTLGTSNNNKSCYNNVGGQLSGPSHYHFSHEPKQNEETRSISPMDPHYSMRVSPCKTGATVITNSSSSTNGSSGALLLGAGSSSICDSTTLVYGSAQQQAMLNGRTDGAHGPGDLSSERHQQQVPMDHMSQFIASSTMNPRNSRLLDKCCGQEHKFSTLSRDAFGQHQQQQQQHVTTDNNMAPLQSSCFRTLPHSNLRPVSTFLSPNALQNHQQQANCQLDGTNEELDFQQQQIYSKLRLLQHFSDAAAAANSCNAMCQQQQQADHEAAMALNQLYGQSGMGDQQSGLNNNGIQQQGAEQDDYALPFPPKWV